MSRALHGAFVAFALAGFTAGGAQAGVTNGNFESVIGASPGGWSVGPGTEILDLTGAGYTPCCGTTGTPAELANHFASFGPGNVPNTSTLSQSIATVANGKYTLSFDAGALGGGSEDIVAAVYGGATLIQSLTVTTTANNNLGSTFSPQSFSFTATGAATNLVFSAVGDGINIDPVIDNVSVTGVPEPATWAMMLVGFGGLGAAIRSARRRTAVAAV